MQARGGGNQSASRSTPPEGMMNPNVGPPGTKSAQASKKDEGVGAGVTGGATVPPAEYKSTRTIWTPEEDRKLREHVGAHGTQGWSRFANTLADRSGKQCRNRWYHVLDPELSREEWTEEEEQILVDLHRRIGKRWALLARQIKGRSETAVKNHWNSVNRTKNHPPRNARSSVLLNYLLTLQPASPHQQAISDSTPSASAEEARQSFSAPLPKEPSRSLPGGLVRAESLPLPEGKRKSPPKDITSEGGLGRHVLESPPKRQKGGEALPRGGNDAPRRHPQPQKSTPLQGTGLAPDEPTEARDPYLGLLYPGDPFSSGAYPRGLDPQDWARLTGEGARAANLEAEWLLGGLRTGNPSGQSLWGGRTGPEGVLETALGAAYDGLSEPGEDGARFRIPDTLFLPRQRHSSRGTAVPRSRGLDPADLSLQSASGLLAGKADERFSGGWASSLVSGRGERTRQETRAPDAPPDKKWPESSGQASQLTLESSPTGVLGGLGGAEFQPPSDEAVTEFLQRWKANFDKWGGEDAPVLGGGRRIPPAQSAISSNSGTRGESHVSTLRTEPPELTDTLGSRPVLQQPGRGMAPPFNPGLYRSLEVAPRQAMAPFPGAQHTPLGNVTWRQNQELGGGLFDASRGGLPTQPRSLAAGLREADLFPRYVESGSDVPEIPRLSTDQLLLLLESYRRLDAVDPPGGLTGVPASFGGSLETGRGEPQSRRHAEAEQLATARSLTHLELTGASNPNPAPDPSAPGGGARSPRRGGIAREIQISPNLPMSLAGLPNFPRYGEALAAGRSNQIFPTTLAMTPNISFGEHLSQLASIAPAPNFQYFQSDRPLYRAGHQAPALPFLTHQGDLSALPGGVYRALGPDPEARVPAAAFAPADDAGRSALSEQQRVARAMPASSALWGPSMNLLRDESLPESRSATSGVATSSELPPKPSGNEAENSAGGSVVPDMWDATFLGP
ncbi:MYB-like DNA-binding protein [Klebsormidium nitens]|uniref:MYB-like DNA-binding protein n=1 Tax=Klebsormidium nitens TaxID=105231 RepID=A0A1Y1HQA4_KLENI|nr:MYB-like DNA-binding protein [Klebsormidium nitens]|eukprot:GAQ79972.1 MYB-like DNA-binding protein [Klebsormidium nitens]